MFEPMCILRHVKIIDQDHAQKASAHNYDRASVPNADQEAPHPTIEFVNTEKRDYWDLAEERIKDAGIKIRRHDQIRCEEIILTASPEWFKRDEQGRAVDMSDSQWLKDIRTYLIETYGEKNLIGFQLQQDEKSPHVHAMVVPITADGRLSCKDVFKPSTLREYQDKFAEAMKPYGLIRGAEHSQAKHQPMKQMYGQQNKTAAELEKQMGEAKSYTDVKVDSPGHVVANPEQWAAKQSQAVNEQARKQVEEANERANKAQTLALENASAKEQVRVLQKQLSTSDKLKEGHKAQSGEAAKRMAGGEAPAEIVSRGNDLLDRDRDRLRVVRQKLAQLYGPATGNYVRLAELVSGPGKELEAEKKKLEADLSRFAGGRSRLKDLDEEPAKLVAEQEQAARDKEVIAQGDRERKQQADALRVQKQELSLMNRAISHWKIGPEDLTACLIVPSEKVKAVQKALTIPGSSYASPISVQGEPFRKDGLEAVYVHYQASFAHQIGAHFSRIREIGGQVYEHAGSQTKREHLQAQPQQKAKEREQGPAPSQDRERD